MNDHRTHQVFAAVAFVVSLVVYIMTMAPTVSFWDCGEFIACSYKLAVPHPPGSPLYLLVGRVFTFIPSFLIENIARRVNLISPLSSAFTVMFLHLIIVYLVRNFLKATDGFMKYVPYMAGLIGSLTFAFSTSFWFNAVEAEVYAPSMLFTGLVVWLIFRWSERSEQIGNERYILLIAYLMGLAIGVHLLNVLALPTILMIIYYKRYEITPTTFLVLVVVGLLLTAFIYPGMVQGIPWVAEKIGFAGLSLVLIMLVGLLAYSVSNRKHLISLLVTSALLITIGYSSYLMIYVRSNLNPNIDENNPETIENFISYMKREQYGEQYLSRERRWQESANRAQYTSAMDFFWTYQVNKMYVRYFLWNFGGIADDGVGADVTKFWLIPLLLGFLGAYYHFLKDWKYGLAVGVLFFMTGLAIIIYLNQPDPQPRERDYSYVGSFFAFAIWVGIGAAAVLEKVAAAWKQARGPNASQLLPWAVALLLLLGAPFHMLAKNYRTQDRTGNYVAWDYSYNMLISAEPDGIIYTNGDNDTFPLWYLQEVENVRPDVRVANLSLLNTSWYISQLKNKEPRVPISLSDAQIERINLQPWPRTQTYEVSTIPEDIRAAEEKRYQIALKKAPEEIPDKISFEVKPKIRIPTRDGVVGALRVQDLMILNTLSANKFRKPLYFAVTTSEQNRMDGLKRFQRMDGLLFKITTLPDWSIDPDVLYDNLMHKFRYRNLNNPRVYFNENITGLVQNYRSAFFRLASYYLTEKDSVRFREVVNKMLEVMPPDAIPFTNEQFEDVMTAFALEAGVYPMDSLNTRNYTLRQLQACAEVGMSYEDYRLAATAYRPLLEELLVRPDAPEVAEFYNALFGGRFRQATPAQQKSAVDRAQNQMLGQLLKAYRERKDYQSAVDFLEKWTGARTTDAFAAKQLEEFRRLRDGQAETP